MATHRANKTKKKVRSSKPKKATASKKSSTHGMGRSKPRGSAY